MDTDQDPLIGTKIGPCRIEMRLAAGGMGVVYRAHHGPTAEDVAVKILAPSLSADQEYVTRFFREAGAAGQIDHPNVVRVIDVGRHEDKYYMIMQYVPGETLDRVLDKERRISLEKATRLVRGIASGLAAAHRAGIIHRDVKPGNVIISRDGTPRLTDFGLARHAETRRGLTVEGTFLGTPEYASPEQVEGRKIDHRTDLYSLGVTYFQLLSGTFPYLGESPMEMAIKRTKEDPRPLENAFPTADPRSCAIVRKLLQREAGQRYQSATDLIRDLDAILMGQQPRAAGPKTPAGEKSPFLTMEGKRRIRAALFWGLLVLGVGQAFLSGALAARGEGPGAWAARDAGTGLRILLMGTGMLAAAGAVFTYRRELVYSGRLWLLLLMVPLMLLGGLAAGLAVDRPEASGPLGILFKAVAALAGHVSAPVNLLGMALFALSLASVFSFERRTGNLRLMVSRLLLWTGFALVLLFGSTQAGLTTAFRNFLDHADLAIPLATGTVLAGLFGTLLLTGYEYGNLTRICGAVLSVAAAVGIYAYIVLVAQRSIDGWAGTLSEPFSGMERAFLRSGTLLLVVAGIGLGVRSIVDAGLRQHDRFFRKK